MGITPAIIGAAAISGGAQIIGSSNAADAQTQAAQLSAQTQQNMFNQTQANLSPFIAQGTNALNTLSPLIGTAAGTNPLTSPLTKPFAPSDLANTPGYQFTLGQGLQAVQNSSAAKGLGLSGSALKGQTQYAEGLASTTYNQQLQNYLAQNSQIYNMLQGQSTQGANAAAGLGTISTQVGANVGNAFTNAGNAQAAGYLGAANGVSNGVNGALGGYMYSQNPFYSPAATASNIGSNPFAWDGYNMTGTAAGMMGA